MRHETPLLDWVPPEPQFNTRDMHRKHDHQTSIDASERIARSVKTRLQEQIHAKLVELGPMTDGELEALPGFAHYGPSTVRKRRSELFQAHRVIDTGERRNHMKIWRAI